MPKKKYRPEDIINKLREADVLQAEGTTVAEVVKVLGIHEQTDLPHLIGSGGRLSLEQLEVWGQMDLS